jgi:hypothetical protein
MLLTMRLGSPPRGGAAPHSRARKTLPPGGTGPDHPCRRHAARPFSETTPGPHPHGIQGLHSQYDAVVEPKRLACDVGLYAVFGRIEPRSFEDERHARYKCGRWRRKITWEPR